MSDLSLYAVTVLAVVLVYAITNPPLPSHTHAVFIYCWYSYAFPISSGIWFGVINFAVHGVMYAYYAVRASGRRPPKWVAQCVTSIQLSQMFGGEWGVREG